MIKRLKVLRAGWLIVLVPVLAACILDPLLARDQEFNRYGIAFQAPVGLKLDQYTLDMQREIFQKGPVNYDQGVVISSEKNFFLAWIYEPQFTPELARLQVVNGPEFFESTSSSVRVTLTGRPATKQISGFDVTFAEMSFELTPDNQAPGIIGVWYCPTSQRAIVFIAIHKRPLRELDRFVSNFSCE